MAEELTKYLTKIGVRCRYVHSDVDTLERIEIMQDLRKGLFDVLVGVNLLREGLDLPEVSLVAILDAYKECFLLSHSSMTQTVGRAARNINGKAIMYADKITESMRITIEETAYRREKQQNYNLRNGIIPKPLNKKIENALSRSPITEFYYDNTVKKSENKKQDFLTKDEIDKKIKEIRKQMEAASKELDFIKAAQYRDELKYWQEKRTEIS